MKLDQIYKDGELYRIRLANGKPYSEDGKPWGTADRCDASFKWQQIQELPDIEPAKAVTDGTG